ncbi:MAG: hypothetical protein GXO69_10915 [Acidobacteria bacterium]|nr:hypothetical protein [Acidobacteriota bacterium]
MKKFMILMLVLGTFQIACGSKGEAVQKTKPAPYSGTVLTVQSGGGYTFLEVKGAAGSFWSATRPIKVKKGDTVQLIHPMKMEKFPVKSLKRTFDVIYFADDVLVNGKGHMGEGKNPMGMGGNMAMNPHGGKTPAGMENPHKMGRNHMGGDATMDASGIKPENGSVSIAMLLKHPEKYAGKTVKVHALVTKYLPMIMKKNWLHLKDASCGDNHLTATTDTEFKAGDKVLVTGKVEVNKDFGFGYKYSVLLSDAKAVK